jgi:integrase
MLYKAVFWVMVCSGVRVGEFIALDFSKDINYTDGEIFVSKSADIHTGEISTPKTETSTRHIPFVKPLLPYLRQLKEFQANGGKFTYPMISCHFKRLYNRLKLLGYNLHSFRHTFISLCYYVGMREKYIQEYAGHATLEMTMNTYTSILKHGFSPFLDYFKELYKKTQKPTY